MPFVKLADDHHCKLPTKRDGGSELHIGDEWQCDEEIDRDAYPRNSGIEDVVYTCDRKYRWVDSQRDGKYWDRLTGTEAQ